ncbi:hypothetical protein QYE76_047072 [Lolium multiflorum]|uniref:Uncharacterized protein n=1 Tax=Lolium multiflorum TaxID=4521 RepID=A0AAD8WZT5_LOLMU|nr:hypothetical protein QYE76_047072 [Lolium multiflorum]
MATLREGGTAASGFGPRNLTTEEAWILYENQYVAPPDMRLPTGWRRSHGGNDILSMPRPSSRRCWCKINTCRGNLTSTQHVSHVWDNSNTDHLLGDNELRKIAVAVKPAPEQAWAGALLERVRVHARRRDDAHHERWGVPTDTASSFSCLLPYSGGFEEDDVHFLVLAVIVVHGATPIHVDTVHALLSCPEGGRTVSFHEPPPCSLQWLPPSLRWEGHLLHQAGYPCPPDTRPPGGGWRLSRGGAQSRRRLGRRLDAAIEEERLTMTDEERADPRHHPKNYARWNSYFLRRWERGGGLRRPASAARNNAAGRRRW